MRGRLEVVNTANSFSYLFFNSAKTIGAIRNRENRLDLLNRLIQRSSGSLVKGKFCVFLKLTLKYNYLNSIGKVIFMVEQKLKVTLLTGRTIEQGVGKEKGKNSKEYFDACSMCYMDAEDMKRLGVKNNTNILVTTANGSVVLKAVKYPRAATPGLIYIPYGPWANAVCSDKTTSIGMPSFKGTPAGVEPAPNKPVLSLEHLLKIEFGR